MCLRTWPYPQKVAPPHRKNDFSLAVKDSMFGLDLKIIVALISALASLLVALITYFATRANQREVEKLKANLQEKQAERNALLDYEYEARKRLYHECAPLIFQLLEQAEGVINRVGNLARTASQGNLEPGRTWLSRRYYRLSTYYRFLSPLATLKLLQLRLTAVDLSLDRYLYCQYLLARQIYYSFADDFDLARASDPQLNYDPHCADAESRRLSSPAIYWQQGIPIGILDNAVQSLISKVQEDFSRVMSFAEFEKEYNQRESSVQQALDRISYLFEDFHPRSRPVLWRMLITHATLYRALLHMRSGQSSDLALAVLAEFPLPERSTFDWRKPDEHVQVNDAKVLHEPFEVARMYLGPLLNRVVEKLSSKSGT